MSTTTVPAQRRRRPGGGAGTIVGQKVYALQRAYTERRDPEATAVLARLRRGVGKEPGELPELWEVTFEDLPVPEYDSDEPTPLERAVYTALTLYAVHQQSQSAPMHRQGSTLGAAVRQLRRQAASDEAVQRRFEALGTADSFREVVHHARGLITQLRGAGIPLDYGRLADDLYRLQDTRGRAAARVRLSWGRDFHAKQKNEENDE